MTRKLYDSSYDICAKVKIKNTYILAVRLVKQISLTCLMYVHVVNNLHKRVL